MTAEREPTLDELLRFWQEDEPVEIIDVTLYRHSSLCALNATGHQGPCTCVASSVGGLSPGETL